MATTDPSSGPPRPNRHHPRLVALSIAMLATALLATSCAGEDRAEQSSSPLPVVVAQDSTRLPFESLDDWGRYADLVAVVEITAEERLEARPESPGGTYVRNVYTAQVLEVLWAPTREAEAETQLTFAGSGYFIKGPAETDPGSEFAFFPNLGVGGQFVVAIGTFHEGRALMTPSSVIPIDGQGRLTAWRLPQRDGRTLERPAVGRGVDLAEASTVGELRAALQTVENRGQERQAYPDAVERWQAYDRGELREDF